MATYYGANRTIMDAPTPSTILDPGLAGGNVRCMVDTYTALGTEAAGSLIEMGGTLPTNARILGLWLTNGDGAATMAVGDLESSGRYIASVAAGATEYMDVSGALGYKVDMTTATTPDNQIVITTAGATLTINLVTRLVVLYTID